MKQQRGGLFPKPLGNGIEQNINAILRNRGFAESSLLKFWGDAVGDDELAKHCFPVKLTKTTNNFNVNGAALIVKVHPAYNAIFAHQADSILQRLNQLLGVRIARKITIIN